MKASSNRPPFSLYVLVVLQILIAVVVSLFSYIFYFAQTQEQGIGPIVMYLLPLVLVVYISVQLCLRKPWAYWLNLIIMPLIWAVVLLPLLNFWGYPVALGIYLVYFLTPTIKQPFFPSLDQSNDS